MDNLSEWQFSRRVSAIAVRHAYRKLRRLGFTGEAERMRVLTSPTEYAQRVEDLGSEKIIAHGIRQAIRDLSNMIRLVWLQAEYNHRIKRGEKVSG